MKNRHPVASQNDRFIQVQLVAGRRADGRPRFIWWNFVSTRQDRIEQAKSDWKVARFDRVPGDVTKSIPLCPSRNLRQCAIQTGNQS
nr:pirin-like C-terminal cupin domain-containing protein [Microvirga sp. VF16]